jgi:tRNA dimethylallyltransferase
MRIPADRVLEARAVLIAGPTASGKSAVALALAEDAAHHGREAWIVNADSMQVYGDLRVITARPSVEMERLLPHRLYGHVAADARYSVGSWLREIAGILADARERGALAIVAGGTGLYFKALTEGLAAIPPTPAAIRRRLQESLAERGLPALQEELRRTDPETALKLRPGDKQRTLRALEVLAATGRPISAWRTAQTEAPLLKATETPRFVLEPPRALLYRRIEERFDGMVDAGALDEVEALLARRLDPDLPVMKAIGVGAFAEVLRGRAALPAAVARAKTETRRYAKRQMTWFRHRMADWRRLAV